MVRAALFSLGMMAGSVFAVAPTLAQLRDVPACDRDAFDEIAAQTCVEAAMSEITQALSSQTSTVRSQLAGSCKPEEYKQWRATVSKLDSLVRFVDLAERRQVLSPYGSQDTQAAERAIGYRFSVADTALGYNCLDIADEQYNAIRQYGLTISAADQLRAFYGVENVRAKRSR
jgi:hypothetical protein